MNLNVKNQPKKKSTLIWAIDPSQKPSDAKNLVTELKTWARTLHCEVQPVAVYSKSRFLSPLDIALPWNDRLENAAEKMTRNYLKKFNTKGFLPYENLFVPALSNRGMAIEMAKYADDRNALAIFANTRSQPNWNPLRLGGFAENLIATSRVPVLLLNPTAIPSTKSPSVLFPTDFSQESKGALQQLLPWAKAFKSKIIIYNQIETPLPYMLEMGDLLPAYGNNLQAIMQEAEKSRLKKAKKLMQEIDKFGIDSEINLQRQEKNIGTEIIELAKKNRVSIIAIASRGGFLAQAVLGGLTKDLVLQAKCPVLVFHKPKEIRKRSTILKRNLRKYETNRKEVQKEESVPQQPPHP